MVRVHMHRVHSPCPQETSQVEPVMACRLHARDYGFHSMPFLQLLDPDPERLESFFCVAECERCLGELVSPPVESPCVMRFASHVDADDQRFFGDGFNFCVLCVRLHFRYLSCNLFANFGGSANLILHRGIFSFTCFLSSPAIYILQEAPMLLMMCSANPHFIMHRSFFVCYSGQRFRLFH